jgi:hypothetical protein
MKAWGLILTSRFAGNCRSPFGWHAYLWETREEDAEWSGWDE